MKSLILASLLCSLYTQADFVTDFLNRAEINEPVRRDRMEVMLRVLQEFSVDDRTLMYIFLEDLNDENEPEESSEECFLCAQGINP